MNKETIRQFLTEISAKDYYDEEQEMSLFKDFPFSWDASVTRCTSSAMMVADHFGGKVFGYLIDLSYAETIRHEAENKRLGKKNLVGWGAGGHDFAIVENFLVDWWAANVAYEGADIYDLSNPEDLAIVQERYLPPDQWDELKMWPKPAAIIHPDQNLIDAY